MLIVNGCKDGPALTGEEFAELGEGTTGIDSEGDLAIVARAHSGAAGYDLLVVFLGDHVGVYAPDDISTTFRACDIEVRRVG